MVKTMANIDICLPRANPVLIKPSQQQPVLRMTVLSQVTSIVYPSCERAGSNGYRRVCRARVGPYLPSACVADTAPPRSPTIDIMAYFVPVVSFQPTFRKDFLMVECMGSGLLHLDSRDVFEDVEKDDETEVSVDAEPRRPAAGEDAN